MNHSDISIKVLTPETDLTMFKCAEGDLNESVNIKVLMREHRDFLLPNQTTASVHPENRRTAVV